MEVRILGAHNSESTQTKLVSLLVDDTLALDAGGLTSSLSLAEQERIRAILLTHRHYDHIRDIPALGLNRYLTGPIGVYSIAPTLEALAAHFMNGEIYIKFTEIPTPEKPVFQLRPLETHQVQTIAGYSVLVIPVTHTAPSVGYQVTSPEGRSVFYSGDTGTGLSSFAGSTSPPTSSSPRSPFPTPTRGWPPRPGTSPRGCLSESWSSSGK